MRLKAFLTLIRPINSSMVGFAVIIGALVANPKLFNPSEFILGFSTGFLISSYSMVVNDYYDIEVDKINNPHRPLASGRVKKKEAITFSLSLLILGLYLSFLTSFENFIIASLFAFLAWIYNYKAKSLGLLGNSIVSLSVAIPYLYGGVMVNGLKEPLIWFLALTSFLASMGREIVKTIGDVKGDKLRKVRSLAITLGKRGASKVGVVFFLLAVISTSFPLILNLVGKTFLILVTLPNLLFLYLSYSILKDCSEENSRRVKNLALFGMLLGLLAFLIGGLIRY